VKRFSIQSASRYRYSFTGKDAWLGFGEDPKFDVMCDALVIGSWSSVSNTWLWGWANDWWEPRVTREVVRVKRFAEEKGLTRLWKKGFKADEALAWHLALGTLSLLPELEGVYRAPDAKGSLFLGAMRTRLVSGGQDDSPDLGSRALREKRSVRLRPGTTRTRAARAKRGRKGP
jgi:hypothetical protein